MTWLWVGLGGALGSLTRYRLGRWISEQNRSNFPFGTYCINLTGALLLGMISGIQLPDSVYLLIGDGFLGAYTTYSTFMYEGFNLYQENEKRNALMYILSSLLLGIVCYVIGYKGVQLFLR